MTKRIGLHDETGERKYFTTVPNIVDDLTATPHDAAVYRAMLRCAGGAGKVCYASTRKIAQLAKVSPAQVSNSKKALVELGFISFSGKHPVGDSGQPIDHYRLPDLWPRNMEHFAQIQERSHHERFRRSPDERKCSPDERKCSRGETKKGSSRKEVPEDLLCSLLDYFNDQLHREGATRFKNYGGLRARLVDDGATPEDVRLVIDFKIAQWLEDEEMRQYIKPDTLFRPTKFPNYLAEARHWDQQGRPRLNGDRPKRPGTSRGKAYYLGREARR